MDVPMLFSTSSNFGVDSKHANFLIFCRRRSVWLFRLTSTKLHDHEETSGMETGRLITYEALGSGCYINATSRFGKSIVKLPGASCRNL